MEAKVKGPNPFHWGDMVLFILPYDKYFNINPHHNLSNQRIVVGFIVIMNPYFSFSTMVSGFRPLSALQSHLPLLYLGSIALIHPKATV